MIKINLLPEEKRKRKKYPIKKLYLLTILVLTFLMIGNTIFLMRSEKTLANKIEKLQQEKAKYKNIAKKIKNLEKKQQKAFKQINLIISLLKESPTMIKDIDLIVKNIPRNKIFLTKFSYNDGNIELIGEAKELNNIAQFIKNLEQTSYFKNIKLKGTKSKKFSSYTVSEFTLLIRK